MNPLSQSRLLIALIAALTTSPFALHADDSHSRAGGASIAYHYVGRVSLNFLTGTGTVYGYLTDLAGIPSAAPLFQGAPSEATAFLTFRADISFQALPGNGPIGGGQFAVTPILVTPGNFRIYFTPAPAHDWNNPDTFSSGQVAATLARAPELFAVLGSSSINAGSAALQSSSTFPLNGLPTNLRDVFPNGVTNITTGPTIALPGSTPTAPIFAFAGYSLVIGNN